MDNRETEEEEVYEEISTMIDYLCGVAHLVGMSNEQRLERAVNDLAAIRDSMQARTLRRGEGC
jgi:hypothetical protein